MSSDTPVEAVLDVTASSLQQSGSGRPAEGGTAPAPAGLAEVGQSSSGGGGNIPMAAPPTAPLPPVPHPSISNTAAASGAPLPSSSVGGAAMRPGTIVIDQRMNKDYSQGAPSPRAYGSDDYGYQNSGRPGGFGPGYQGGKPRVGGGGMPAGPTAPVLVSPLSGGQVLGNPMQMPGQHQMVRLSRLHLILFLSGVY